MPPKTPAEGLAAFIEAYEGEPEEEHLTAIRDALEAGKELMEKGEAMPVGINHDMRGSILWDKFCTAIRTVYEEEQTDD